MPHPSSRKPISTKVRIIFQLLPGAVMLTIPPKMPTPLVLAYLSYLLVGIWLLSQKIRRFTPWQLAQLQCPDPVTAFAESLVYTVGGFGLLIYLVSSEHTPWHFALGFLGILASWLLIQLIYSQQYALRYYHDGTGFIFPDCSRPHWTEFLYEGFCMAACYQTSDTVVNSTPMRQLVATHGILSYTLSISIIAMMFGLISNIL